MVATVVVVVVAMVKVMHRRQCCIGKIVDRSVKRLHTYNIVSHTI